MPRVSEILRIQYNEIISILLLENCWTTFRKVCFTAVYDPFAVLFVMVCIILNTLCMAVDHHNMSFEMDRILRSANFVSTTP